MAPTIAASGVQFTTFAPLGLVPFRFSQAELSCAAAQPLGQPPVPADHGTAGRPRCRAVAQVPSGCGVSRRRCRPRYAGVSAVLSSGLCPAGSGKRPGLRPRAAALAVSVVAATGVCHRKSEPAACRQPGSEQSRCWATSTVTVRQMKDSPPFSSSARAAAPLQ